MSWVKPGPLPKFPKSSSNVSHCLFSWEIPPDQQALLDRYYLLHWQTDYFLEHHSRVSEIPHQGINYYTHFMDGIIPKNLFKYQEMILSFRRIRGWTSGYVLIRPKLGSEFTS
jgi:hypothetical protein